MKNPGKNAKVNTDTQKSVSLWENKYESTTCDAVLLTKSKIGDDEETKEEAKDALEKALRDEDLYIENVRGELFIGNHGGLDLARVSAEVRAVKDEIASRRDEFLEKLTTQKDEFLEKLTSQKDQLSQHEHEITQLRNQVLGLTGLPGNYMLVRDRFISTFKRKLQTADATDHDIIKEGNMAAHGGHAIIDATLYTSLNKRSDIKIFKMLYGLEPSQVSGLGEHQLFPSLKRVLLTCSEHRPTITALNTHASIISSQDKVGCEKFDKAFAAFIRLLKESNYDASYLDDGKASSLTDAYKVFLQCAKDEITVLLKSGRAAHLDLYLDL